MGTIGDCCCCPITIEDLPNWQIEGFEVLEDWYSPPWANGDCCFFRSYVVQGNEHLNLQISGDLSRFFVSENSRVDAKAMEVRQQWRWKGYSAPTALPPGELCPVEAGIIGYVTCATIIEQKRRAYLYSQPWRIDLRLSNHFDRCDTEPPQRRVYTLTIVVHFRASIGTQEFLRECTRLEHFVTHPCYESNGKPDTIVGCGTQNLDYENLPEHPGGWQSSGIRVVTIRQFEDIPDTLPFNSHDSPIGQSEYVDCIAGLIDGCHPMAPGVVNDTPSCWTFDDTNVMPYPDRTPFVRIVSNVQQNCLPIGDCTPPDFGVTFFWHVFCPEPMSSWLSHRFTLASPPLCTETWNSLAPQTSAPPGAKTTPICALGTGDPLFNEIWYRLKPNVTCCTAGVPCPSDGQPPGGGDDGNPLGPPGSPGNPNPPPGYESGWFGGGLCTVPGKWSQHSYSVNAAYTPLTPVTLCVSAVDLVLELPP